MTPRHSPFPPPCPAAYFLLPRHLPPCPGGAASTSKAGHCATAYSRRAADAHLVRLRVLLSLRLQSPPPKLCMLCFGLSAYMPSISVILSSSTICPGIPLRCTILAPCACSSSVDCECLFHRKFLIPVACAKARSSHSQDTGCSSELFFHFC